MDPISNMLSSIRNALAVEKNTVDVSFSKLKHEITKILEKEGYIERIEKKGRGVKKIIRIFLKYENKIPVISGLRKISKPGQRIYLKSKEIKSVRHGYGKAIVSTSKGLMTDKEARKQKLGGEIICEVW